MEGGLGVGAGRVTRGGGPGRVVPAQRLAWVAVLVAGLAARSGCGSMTVSRSGGFTGRAPLELAGMVGEFDAKS